MNILVKHAHQVVLAAFLLTQATPAAAMWNDPYTWEIIPQAAAFGHFDHTHISTPDLDGAPDWMGNFDVITPMPAMYRVQPVHEAAPVVDEWPSWIGVPSIEFTRDPADIVSFHHYDLVHPSTPTLDGASEWIGNFDDIMPVRNMSYMDSIHGAAPSDWPSWIGR